MAKKKTTSIALVDIQDKEVFIKEPSIKLQNSFEREKLKLGINVNFDTITDKELLILNISSKYEYPFEDGHLELLRASFSFKFEIKGLKKIINSDDGKIDIPDGLALNLMSISLSTTRGLIAAKSRGYFINKFYFPIINPQKLVEGFNDKDEKT